MSLTDALQHVVRTLVQPIAATPHPEEHAKHAAAAIASKKLLPELSPAECATSLRAALATDAHLAGVIPQDHPEVIIRAYLDAVAGYLEKLEPPTG